MNRVVQAAAIMILMVLAACGSTISITDVDPCIQKVKVTAKQGSTTFEKEVDNKGGTVSGEVQSAFDLKKDIEVVLKIVKLKQTDDCLKKFPKGTEYRFSYRGKTDTKNSISLKKFTRSYGVDVPKRGRVRIGGIDKPKNRFLIWIEPKAGSLCKKTCWEQWAKASMYYISAAGTQEIMKGTPWQDHFGNGQAYGAWGRDKPLPGTNCFRDDPIPNESPHEGVVDAPGHPPTVVFAQKIYRATKARFPGQKYFTVRYVFDMRSILICLDPIPKAVLGYVTWKVVQEFHYYDKAGKLAFDVKYRGEAFEWKDGAGGLEPQMIP